MDYGLWAHFSALNSRQLDAFDKEALIENKNDQDWKNRHDRSGHEISPIRVVQALEIRQADREREFGFAVQHNQGPHKTHPRSHESECGQGRKRRLRQRKNDFPKNSEVGAAVDFGRVFELFRERQEKLPKQKSSVGRENAGQNKRLMRVHPAEMAQQNKNRNHGHRARDHHCGQVSEENFVASGKFETRESVSRHRTCRHLAQRDQKGNPN